MISVWQTFQAHHPIFQKERQGKKNSGDMVLYIGLNGAMELLAYVKDLKTEYLVE
tara:strand:- start:478 stop:642 length:165 start_codon:yes stop_codon:yes gene_type:complete